MLDQLSPLAISAIVVLVALQLLLQIAALFDLARRDQVRYGRKWIWVLVIILGNLLGVIAYFAFGIRWYQPAEPAARSVAEDPEAGVAQLYRKQDRG
ncbi:MAG TPA: PLD nuclease N-terminal domain-containing protein [Gemmatimonadales bacterium]|nr:PLD nuclease N-terminal domain-containing protein [Gemmatimonadales bacterium]